MHTAQPRYLLNLCPILIPEETTLKVAISKFETSEKLKALRDEHRGKLLFLRRNDSVLCTPLMDGASPVGDTVQEYKASQDLGLITRVTKEAFISHFVKQGVDLIHYEPLTIRSKLPSKDLLSEVLKTNRLSGPDWLSVKLAPTLTLRTFSLNNGLRFLGVAVNFRTTIRISASVAELLKQDIDILSKYVCIPKPAIDGRFQSNLKAVGKVASINNNLLNLEDQRDDFDGELTAELAYLEPRFENLQVCLDRLFPKKSALISHSLRTRLSQVRSGPALQENIKKFVSWLQKNEIKLFSGQTVSVGDLVNSHSPGFPSIKMMSRPTFIFNPSRDRTSTWPDMGLQEHGPYDRATFHAPKPNILVVCQSQRQGDVERFVCSLLEGMPIVKSGNFTPHGQGFLRKFNLEPNIVEFSLADNDTSEAYVKSINDAVRSITDRGQKWHLALVQVDEEFKQRHPNQNPYLAAKAACLRHGIASQKFRMETVNSTQIDQAISLNQMSLASYAKMGGLPWLLATTPGVAHELVIGLGSASISNRRLGAKERIVGITTVFSGDGNYIFEKRSEAIPFDQFLPTLLNSLRSTVSDVRRRLNWQKGQTVRLVFHAFKPFKHEEVQAISDLMQSLISDMNVQYAYVQIIEDQPLILFDQEQPGIQDFKSRMKKGIFSPDRGSYINLSQDEILQVYTGAKEVKRPEHGISLPTLIRVHRLSTFKDITYLARQAFFFSCHSWRTFLPSSAPVTMLYSDLIARQLGLLNQLTNWNDDVMSGEIGTTRWFL